MAWGHSRPRLVGGFGELLIGWAPARATYRGRAGTGRVSRGDTRGGLESPGLWGGVSEGCGDSGAVGWDQPGLQGQRSCGDSSLRLGLPSGTSVPYPKDSSAGQLGVFACPEPPRTELWDKRSLAEPCPGSCSTSSSIWLWLPAWSTSSSNEHSTHPVPWQTHGHMLGVLQSLCSGQMGNMGEGCGLRKRCHS